MQSQTEIRGAVSEHWGFRPVFKTLGEVLKETELGPSFSQLVRDHLSQVSREFEHDFTTTNTLKLGRSGSVAHL